MSYDNSETNKSYNVDKNHDGTVYTTGLYKYLTNKL